MSGVVTPEFNTDSEYMAEGKIVPGSTGHVEITIDYTNVTVPFKYEISFDDTTLLEDFKFTGYSIDGVAAEEPSTLITNTILPTAETKTQTLKLNFGWYDGQNEEVEVETEENSDDIQDTLFAKENDSLSVNFNITFTQINPNELNQENNTEQNNENADTPITEQDPENGENVMQDLNAETSENLSIDQNTENTEI